MSQTGWTKAGCRALGLDDTIETGDFVADSLGEDRSTSVPGRWFPAVETVGKTPRQADVFACRPLQKGGEA